MPEFDSTLEYRSIQGFVGYLIGSDGSLWSQKYKDRLISRWRKLKPTTNRRGYLYIRIGTQKSWRDIHRLVLEAFVGLRPKGMEGCHFPDADKTNNQLKNLSWKTHQENMSHMAIHGSMPLGENNHNAKLSDEQVRQMVAEYRTGGISQSELGRRYGMHSSGVSRLVRGLSRNSSLQIKRAGG